MDVLRIAARVAAFNLEVRNKINMFVLNELSRLTDEDTNAVAVSLLDEESGKEKPIHDAITELADAILAHADHVNRSKSIPPRHASSPLVERPDYGSSGGASVPRGETAQEASFEQTGVIKKIKGKGYCVKSPKNSDWSGGCYPTKAEAEKRLRQVEMFKHMK